MNNYIADDRRYGTSYTQSLNKCLHKHVAHPHQTPSCSAIMKPLKLSNIRNVDNCVSNYVETRRLSQRCDLPQVQTIVRNINQATTLCIKAKQQKKQ